MINFKNQSYYVLILLFSLLSCGQKEVKEINIAYIGPLSEKAIDIGTPSKNAIELAIEEYNTTRTENQPIVNFFFGDDKWQGKRALTIYDSLNKIVNLDVVFISNTEGTLVLQERIKANNDLLINPTNSDSLLSSLGGNTIKIAKKTEEANEILAVRAIELGIKKVAVFYYPNDFMQRAAYSIQNILENTRVEYKLIKTNATDTNFINELKALKDEQYGAYMFMGYSNFGYAMKQARDLGIKAPFFGSTTLLDPNFFKLSKGAIVGTECTYFKEIDGNFTLAKHFVADFTSKYNHPPKSIWPAMQAYDATNILLKFVSEINEREKEESVNTFLINSFHDLSFYQGTSGNISIGKKGASKGIYFNLYKYSAENTLNKIKR